MQGKSSSPISRSLTCTPVGVDFGDGVFGALHGFLALGLAPPDQYTISTSVPPLIKMRLRQRLHLAVNFFDQRFGLHGRAQQRLQHRQQSLELR